MSVQSQENTSIEKADDALELALLLYDIYKEGQNNNEGKKGLNNADEPKNE